MALPCPPPLRNNTHYHLLSTYVSGTVLSISYALLHLFSEQPYEVGAIIIIPFCR